MNKNLESLDSWKFKGNQIMKSSMSKILGGELREGTQKTGDFDCQTGECIPTGKSDSVLRTCTGNSYDSTITHADGSKATVTSKDGYPF
jgi:hypothetical protein